MELPTETDGYVTIAILDMPFRAQKYGPWGEAHQAIWQQAMERLEQLQVVGWQVCWARVVDKPTNLAIIVYHPKHPSKSGPEHDSLFLTNILHPLVECIRYPPRIINLQFNISTGLQLTAPQHKIVELFLLDISTTKSSRRRHDSLNSSHSGSSSSSLSRPSDPISTLPMTSFIPVKSSHKTTKNQDFRTVRRGSHLPRDSRFSGRSVRHECFTVEFASHKARQRFQDPTKPSTGVASPPNMWANAWDLDLILPLQRLRSEGLVLGQERLCLEMRPWPLGTPKRLTKDMPPVIYELDGRELGATMRNPGVEAKKSGWFDRAWGAFRTKPEEIIGDDDDGANVEHIQEVINWAKGHSRKDSGYSSGTYTTVLTTNSI